MYVCILIETHLSGYGLSYLFYPPFGAPTIVYNNYEHRVGIRAIWPYTHD